MRRVALLLSALLVSLSSVGFAQNLTFGSLAGTLTDSAGATIPGAKITLVNLGTDDRRNAVTDSSGFYQFLNLQPATYRLEAESAGFKRFVRNDITIMVNQAARIDVAMEIGAVSESVEVTAATPLLEPETSSLGQVVDGRQVRDLPLNGRNPLALVALVPGVVPQLGSQVAPSGQNPFSPGNFQIGGGTANQSQMYLDGASLNLNYGNVVAMVPTQDSIAEFKVQTNSLSAEFGRTSGGIINMATRTGSNKITGSAYEYLRNRSLNANTFFNNRAGQPRPSFVQNQYGIEAAGPIKKDKLFIMGNWEGFRQRVGHPIVSSVPTVAERAGDFSNLRGANGALIPIYDPYTACGSFGNGGCAKDANGNNVVVRQPFPNNTIPASRINPAAAAYDKTSWALPNTQGAAFTNVNNFIGNPSGGANSDWLTLRSDLNISAKQRLFGRYSLWKSLTLEIDPFGTHAYPAELVQGSPESFKNQQAVIGDTYSFSATMIADVRVSWLRQFYNRASTSLGYDLTQLGWPAFMNSEVSARFLPAVNVQGLSAFIANTGSLIHGRTDDRSVAGSLTKIAGSHALKFGGEVRIGPYNYLQLAGGTGTYSFTSTFTASNPFSPAGGTGFASYLLGTGASGSVTTSQPVSGQQIYRALFFQDDWRVNRKLTLNLGVRWDLAGPWSERYNRLSVFLPNATSPLAQQVNLPLKGEFALVNSTGNPSRTNSPLDKKLFAPRIGLAYQLTPKTVIRSAYGIFYIPTNLSTNNDPHSDVVNSAANPWVPTIDSITPFTLFNNPFPNGLTQPAGRTGSVETSLWGTSPSTIFPNNPNGYMQQWNFNVQRELPFGIYVDAAYAGSKGTHLPVGGFQVDQLPDQDLALGSKLNTQVPNPFYGVVNQGNLQTPTVSLGQLLRPYPQFNGLTEQIVDIGSAVYESFQLKVQRRFAAGASILAAYTNAKLISIGTDSLTSFLETDGGISGVQNFNNFRAERAVASFDVPQRLVVSFALDMPFGSGKHYLSHLNGPASKAISGWAMEGIATFQSGLPIHVTATPNTTGSLGGGVRPNSTGKSAHSSGTAQSRLNQWFNTGVFTQPAPFTFGNTGRDLPDVRSAGVNNWDLAFVKNTTIRERFSLQFRAEFFNLFNRVQFGFPGQTLGTPQFGVVSSQVNQPRLLQLALRMQW